MVLGQVVRGCRGWCLAWLVVWVLVTLHNPFWKSEFIRIHAPTASQVATAHPTGFRKSGPILFAPPPMIYTHLGTWIAHELHPLLPGPVPGPWSILPILASQMDGESVRALRLWYSVEEGYRLVLMPSVTVDAPAALQPDGPPSDSPPDETVPDETGPDETGPDETVPDDPDTTQPAPVYRVEVVTVYPHDPNAFTQGLEIRDGELFEGTGQYGGSSLRRVDLETGQVLQQIDLPARYFGEGITVFEDRIFQLTWQSNIGFIYDRESFEQLDTVHYSTEGWGLTHDGNRLIMSDGTSRIFFRDPETFDVLKILQVRDGERPIVRLNELEYIEGEIWANIWLTDRIARIDPETGRVVGWLDLTGIIDPASRRNADAVLNGIAYDVETERIFVTGKLWPYLFEIRVVEAADETEPEAYNHLGRSAPFFVVSWVCRVLVPVGWCR